MCFESPRLLVERPISQQPFLELFFYFLRQKPCLILQKLDDGGERGKHNDSCAVGVPESTKFIS